MGSICELNFQRPPPPLRKKQRHRISKRKIASELNTGGRPVQASLDTVNRKELHLPVTDLVLRSPELRKKRRAPSPPGIRSSPPCSRSTTAPSAPGSRSTAGADILDARLSTEDPRRTISNQLPLHAPTERDIVSLDLVSDSIETASETNQQRKPGLLNQQKDLVKEGLVNELKDRFGHNKPLKAVNVEPEDQFRDCNAIFKFSTYKAYNPPPRKSDQMRHKINLFDGQQKAPAPTIIKSTQMKKKIKQFDAGLQEPVVRKAEGEARMMNPSILVSSCTETEQLVEQSLIPPKVSEIVNQFSHSPDAADAKDSITNGKKEKPLVEDFPNLEEVKSRIQNVREQVKKLSDCSSGREVWRSAKIDDLSKNTLTAEPDLLNDIHRSMAIQTNEAFEEETVDSEIENKDDVEHVEQESRETCDTVVTNEEVGAIDSGVSEGRGKVCLISPDHRAHGILKSVMENQQAFNDVISPRKFRGKSFCIDDSVDEPEPEEVSVRPPDSLGDREDRVVDELEVGRQTVEDKEVGGQAEEDLENREVGDQFEEDREVGGRGYNLSNYRINSFSESEDIEKVIQDIDETIRAETKLLQEKAMRIEQASAKAEDDCTSEPETEQISYPTDSRRQSIDSDEILESDQPSGWSAQRANQFRTEKQVSWVDEVPPPTRDSSEDCDKSEEAAEKKEKGSRTMKRLRIIRQKTFEYVQGKETEWKSNISKNIKVMKNPGSIKRKDFNQIDSKLLNLEVLDVRDEVLMKSPLKRKKKIECIAEKLHHHNTAFLGSLSSGEPVDSSGSFYISEDAEEKRMNQNDKIARRMEQEMMEVRREKHVKAEAGGKDYEDMEARRTENDGKLNLKKDEGDSGRGKSSSSSAGGKKSGKDKMKSTFSIVNDDWNNFLKDIGSASVMNQKENLI